jgi:hypothetical protein
MLYFPEHKAIITMYINLVKFTEIHSSHLIHLALNLTVRHEHLLKLHSIQPQPYKVREEKNASSRLHASWSQMILSMIKSRN